MGFGVGAWAFEVVSKSSASDTSGLGLGLGLGLENAKHPRSAHQAALGGVDLREDGEVQGADLADLTLLLLQLLTQLRFLVSKLK